MPSRKELLDEIRQTFGIIPGWVESYPDAQLEHQWGLFKWYLGDSKLSARDKALVGFGAAAAVHCPY